MNVANQNEGGKGALGVPATVWSTCVVDVRVFAFRSVGLKWTQRVRSGDGDTMS